MWLLKPEGFQNEVLAQQLDRDMQVLTKLAGYRYVGLLPAVRPIPPYICADFASPGYLMGWNSFGWGARITFGGLQPPSPALATSLLMSNVYFLKSTIHFVSTLVYQIVNVWYLSFIVNYYSQNNISHYLELFSTFLFLQTIKWQVTRNRKWILKV